jgi:starvation-inducible outer membrane lipoprotein
MKNVWQKILAVALCALTLAACRTLPEKERADAETAYKKAQISKQCKTDKYMAAESLIIEARKNVKR